jgi:hypothetical protein
VREGFVYEGQHDWSKDSFIVFAKLNKRTSRHPLKWMLA